MTNPFATSPGAVPIPNAATRTQDAFGPGYNLIGQQFNPQQSGQLGQLGQQTQQAGQNVQMFNTQPFQGVPTSQYGQYTNQAQDLLGQAGSAAQQAGNYQTFGQIGQQPMYQTNDYMRQAGQELGNVQSPQFGTIGSASDPRIQQLEQQQQFGIAGAGGNSPEAMQLRGLTSQAAEGLAGAPSRQDIALQTLQNLDAEQADIRQLGIQDIGRAGARLGRLGSGMVTTSLGDLESQLNSQRERSLRDLSAQTASQEMGDRLAALSGLSGAGGQFRAEDLAGGGLGLQQSSAYGGLAGDIYGRDAGLRAEDRGERNFQYGAGSDAAQLALQRLGAGQGLASQQFGQDQTLRSQDVDERAFQMQQQLMQSGMSAQQAQLLSQQAAQQFGQGSALRSEDRGERADMTAQQQMQLQNLLAQQQAAQSQQGQQFGQEQINRNEYRTEREYQQALDQQNLQNQLGIQNQGFNQNMDISQLLADIGFGSGRYGNLTANLLGTQQGQTNSLLGAGFDFAQAAGGTPPPDLDPRVRDPNDPYSWLPDIGGQP